MAVCTDRVLPNFFDKTMDSGAYVKINKDFMALLEEEGGGVAWSQEDRAIAHIAEKNDGRFSQIFRR